MNDIQPDSVEPSVESSSELPTSADSSRVRLVRRVAGLVALVGLVAASLPILPAIAVKDSRKDFTRCTADLANFKISSEEAYSACSRSLYPEYLGICVRRVVSRGGYEPADALAACRVVRRPTDMGECVTDIRDRLKDAVAADVLDSCRRSLLPVRYADCVIGVSRGASGLTPANALSSCSDVQYFPREVDPTFLPYAPGQSTLPVEPVQPVVPPQVTPAPTPSPAPSPAPVRGLY